VGLLSAHGALVSVELLLGVVVDLQDVVSFLGDTLLPLGLSEVIQGSLGLTQGWSSGVHGLKAGGRGGVAGRASSLASGGRVATLLLLPLRRATLGSLVGAVHRWLRGAALLPLSGAALGSPGRAALRSLSGAASRLLRGAAR
jgi:hypothetical protein